MFANRFTVFADACTLAGALKRNLLLSLAEAEFFRIRWSTRVLDETENAIREILEGKGAADAADRASASRKAMADAFEEAMVADYDAFLCLCEGFPDPSDAHVVAAAVKTQASMIVTDNLRHFPPARLAVLSLEVRTTDSFIANTIDLDIAKAVAAIQRMRARLNKPAKTAEVLLLDMEASGLTETVDLLRPYVQSL